MLVIGWPVTLAVDLAVIYVVARIIFGAHPVVPFLLLLGIACRRVRLHHPGAVESDQETSTWPLGR